MALYFLDDWKLNFSIRPTKWFNTVCNSCAGYLHKKGNNEDSIPLAEGILQRVKQRAVPVNQMELQQSKGYVWEAIVENRCREQTQRSSAGTDWGLLCETKAGKVQVSDKHNFCLRPGEIWLDGTVHLWTMTWVRRIDWSWRTPIETPRSCHGIVSVMYTP